MTIEAIQLPLLPLPPLRRGEPLLALRLPMEPMVARRGRAVVRQLRRGPVADVVDDKGYARWKWDAITLLVAYWRGRPPLRVPMIVQVVSVLHRPRSCPRPKVGGEPMEYPFPWGVGRNPHLGTEDLDNLRKGPLDVLTQARVIVDDRLVVEDGGSGKWYAAEGEEPCVDIRAWHA